MPTVPWFDVPGALLCGSAGFYQRSTARKRWVHISYARNKVCAYVARRPWWEQWGHFRRHLPRGSSHVVKYDFSKSPSETWNAYLIHIYSFDLLCFLKSLILIQSSPAWYLYRLTHNTLLSTSPAWLELWRENCKWYSLRSTTHTMDLPRCIS